MRLHHLSSLKVKCTYPSGVCPVPGRETFTGSFSSAGNWAYAHEFSSRIPLDILDMCVDLCSGVSEIVGSISSGDGFQWFLTVFDSF